MAVSELGGYPSYGHIIVTRVDADKLITQQPFFSVKSSSYTDGKTGVVA
jgi:hypothetical protein